MAPPPIIVGGFFRSGTTLLRRILDSHSHIHCGPEVKFMRDFFGDYPNDPLRHVRLFATARTYGLPDDRLLATFGRAFVEFHEQAAAAAGKSRWADKNPENVLFLDAWRSLLPAGFVFIEMVRNPLDALASLEEIGFPKAVPAGFPDKVALYARYRAAGERQLQEHASTTFRVSYESLAAAPERTVKSIMDWLREPFEPACLCALNAAERGSGIEDPKSRLHATVHGRSIGRGAGDLSAEAKRIVERELGEYLA